MKTFRLIGMAFMAVLLSVNFAACSSSDDEPNENGGTSNTTKKLVGIIIEEDNYETEILTFTYNEEGKLIAVKDVETVIEYTQIDNYTWGNNSIYEDDRIYYLDNNMIESIRYRNNDIGVFTYNSAKQLSVYTDTEDSFTYRYNWENDKITQITNNENETITITYGNEKCKGYFPFLLFFRITWEGLIFVHPELTGTKINYLPTYSKAKNEKTTYDYSLDSEGYIKKCIAKKDDWITTYTFEWQ